MRAAEPVGWRCVQRLTALAQRSVVRRLALTVLAALLALAVLILAVLVLALLTLAVRVAAAVELRGLVGEVLARLVALEAGLVLVVQVLLVGPALQLLRVDAHLLEHVGVLRVGRVDLLVGEVGERLGRLLVVAAELSNEVRDAVRVEGRHHCSLVSDGCRPLAPNRQTRSVGGRNR